MCQLRIYLPDKKLKSEWNNIRIFYISLLYAVFSSTSAAACCGSVGFVGRFWALYVVTSWNWVITEETQCICLCFFPPGASQNGVWDRSVELLCTVVLFACEVNAENHGVLGPNYGDVLFFFSCCCKAASIPWMCKVSKAAVCKWSRIYMLPEAVYNEVPITIVRYFGRAKCHWFVYLPV